MRNNKGVTLISLIGYVIISLMVISVLITITANFKKNFNELNVQTVHEVELDKINLQISKEIKDGNEIDKEQITENKLTFSNGNVYTYVIDDKAIYLNNTISIAENITACKFELVGENILRLTVAIEGKQRIMEYVVE